MALSTYIKKYNINRDFLLFTLVVIAVCLLYTDKVYSAKMKMLKSKRASIEALKTEIAAIDKEAGGSLKEKKAGLKRFKAEYEALLEEQKRLFKRFPNKAEASKMLGELVSEKKFSGINFESFYPSEAVPTDNGYFYVPIEVVVSGSFNKLGEYIKYIENLPRTFIIDDILFQAASGDETSSSCTVRLKGKTYILKY
jgi:Tfp pilus assembly protein PilO